MMKALLTLLVMLTATSVLQAQEYLFRDNFADTNAWRALEFPKIEKHSTYEIVVEGTNSILTATTDASASGLIFTNTFNVKDYPIVRWRWKVDHVFTNGNATIKEGDDYPARVYIIFEYDPDKAGFGTRAKYGLAKKIYGEYPPHSSLNYIWANRDHKKGVIVSPYTSRSRMIPLQSGSTNAGIWITETVDILKDYKKAFKEAPPLKASLAIMSDSDNTKESGTAHFDFIEVLKRPEKETP
jgi:hypothetical protein